MLNLLGEEFMWLIKVGECNRCEKQYLTKKQEKCHCGGLVKVKFLSLKETKGINSKHGWRKWEKGNSKKLLNS